MIVFDDNDDDDDEVLDKEVVPTQARSSRDYSYCSNDPSSNQPPATTIITMVAYEICNLRVESATEKMIS
jgi:hypothetical protein